jgi:N-acyl-D-aspartate/D-glutamate deacylase
MRPVPLLLLPMLAALPLPGQTYDVVLRGGRVMDPASGLDAVRDIGIRGKQIRAISKTRLKGQTEIDATGLVVAPGFIDLHSHGQDDENYRLKAMDGVTTALELEVGVSPVGSWYAARRGKAMVNFGATVGHIPIRMAIMKDSGSFLPRDEAVRRRATPAETDAMLGQLSKGLDDGALGIGLGVNYTAAATREEILSVFRLAAQRKVPIYVHIRFAGAQDPGSFATAMQEVIADAAVTGASLHVVHLTSVAMRQAPLGLEMIEGARKRGVDVTTEMYPYPASNTDLASALFDDGWQERLGIGFGDLQWAATGERLTAASFAKYRKQGGSVIVFNIPEEVVRGTIVNPMVMIASDGGLRNGVGHPRSAGSYARVLGKYVRDEKQLTLMDALRKMTVMPADRLGLANKGRLARGGDADIAVFDPQRVNDRATFQKPSLPSEGFRYVLVNGVFVVRDGRLVEGAMPGTAVRR